MPERPPDYEIARTLAQIEAAVARLRRQLAVSPEAVRAPRRKTKLRDLALSCLREDEWMSMSEWETALIAVGYRPPADAKRADQTRRSLASLAARNKHIIASDGTGSYRLHAPQDADPLAR